MMKTFHLVAPLAISVALAGGCKYTGGGDKQPEQEQSSNEKTEAEQPKKPAEKKAEPEKSDKAKADNPYGLGEGTDVQRRLMAKAKQAFLTEQLDRAEELFGALVKTEPVSGPQVSGAIALAQIYNETDRPEKALELYDQLSERVDDVPEVQLVIARAFAKQGESTRAIEAYKKLLEIQPDFVFALLELGKLYGEAGRKEEATKALYEYEKKVYAMAAKLENPETKPADRMHILDVFSLVSDDRATQAVAKMLAAEHPKLRKKAAVVLGETGAIETKVALEKVAVNDPELGVRMAAKDALERFDELGIEAPDKQIGPKFVGDGADLPDD